MEQITLKKMREIIGWPNGDGDGIFSPGKQYDRFTLVELSICNSAAMEDGFCCQVSEGKRYILIEATIS